MNNLNRYIKEYKNNEFRYFLSNPLFRIKATHILGTIILVVSALFFTDNLVAVVLQLLVAFVVTIHDFDDKFIKINLASKIDELNSSQKYIRTILDTSPHAIIAIEDGMILSIFNKTAEDMFGFKYSEILDIDDLTKIIPINNILDTFKRDEIKNLVGKTLELKGLNKDGTHFPIRVTLGFNKIKNKSLIVIDIKDITFEKEQQKINASHQRHAQMGEMIGNIAHQWRQPLSGITMLATSSKITNSLGLLSTEELDKTFDKISDYSLYLSQTIEDFRNFYKEDKEIEKFNMIEKVDFSIALIDAAYKDSEITIFKKYSKKALDINGLPNEFSQVVVNILNNAKDILKEKEIKDKIVFIKIFQDEHYNICKIYDNGGGVPSNIINKIFDPYFTTKHQSQGTGIGLHMSKDIIQSSLDGILDIQNQDFIIDNKSYFGASFIIKIPIA